MFSSIPKEKKEQSLDMLPTDATSVPIDDITKFIEKSEQQDKLKQKTQEEREKENRDRTDAGFTTILYRQFGMNKDIVLLCLFGVLCILFGYCLMFVRMSFTTDQIKIGIRDFFEILFSLLAAAGTFVWRVYTPPGKFTKDLMRRANKDESKLNDWGRTIPGK